MAPRLHWYLSRVVLGVERVLHAAGYDLSLVAIETPKRRSDFLDAAQNFARRVDALLLVDFPEIEGSDERLSALPNPVLTLGMTVPGRSSITIDNLHAGYTATSHLVELGHRRVGLVAVTDGVTGVIPASGVERAVGYRRALAENGIEPCPTLVFDGDWSPASGQAAMRRFLELDDRPTAVFALSDEMAFGALAEARAAGLDVPGDLSIIGFDDHELSAVFGLSTMQQSVDKLGERAASTLLELLADPEQPPQAETWSVRLVTRASSGPAPVS